MDLYICEKPNQGRDLAKILKCTKRHEGYLTNDSQIVTWCVGHLLELLEPDDYDSKYKKWNIQDLPIIPENYRYKVKKNVAKQYKVIQELAKKATTIFISTDFDREGEAIARTLLDRFNYKGIIKRVCLTALDDSSIKKALNNIKEGHETEPLYHAALGRSHADWLVGMNLSRLFTMLGKNLGFNDTIQIGRVLTPTVTLVVKRDLEIINFKPTPYFELFIDATTAKGQFKAKWIVPEQYQDPDGHCINRQFVEDVANKVINQIGNISKAERKQVTEAPPLPFDLTSLQQYASKKWGYTAQQTLDAAQNLYEKYKATTYPRTDCRYIPDSQLQERDNIFTSLVLSDPNLADSVNFAKKFTHKPKAFNTSKVEAHHAIIPTMATTDISQMNQREKNIYNAIRCYYLIQFCPNAIFDKASIELNCLNEVFVANGKVLKDQGYRQILILNDLLNLNQNADKTNDAEDENSSNYSLPEVQVGDQANIFNASILDKVTTPPAHFTEATLLAAMENISRFVTDEKFKKILKETAGIGTPATRASILESAIHHNYLERNKKWIISTDKAQNVIPHLPKGLQSAGLTAAWEQELDKIAHKQSNLSEFMFNIEKWIKSIIMNYNDPTSFTLDQEFLNQKYQEKSKTYPCFSCGSNLRRIKGSKGYFWGCQNPECKTTYNDKDGVPVPRKPKVEQQIPEGMEIPNCPNCGKPMKIRTAKYTGKQFWGCSDYPKCKTILDLTENKDNSLNKPSIPTGDVPICTKCGKPMKLRKVASTGKEFWGCSGYPKCKNSIDTEMINNANIMDIPTCTICGSKMTLRTSSKNGKKFWGCSNYPSCKGLLNYNE